MTTAQEILPDNTGIVDEDRNIRPLHDDPELVEFPDDTADAAPAAATAPNRRETSVILPETIGAARKRIRDRDLAVIAVREAPLTAYEELGDAYTQRELSLPAARPLDEIIRGSQEWHTTIELAIQNLGLNEVMRGDFENATATSRVDYMLHVAKILATAKYQAGMIHHVEGNRDLDVRVQEFTPEGASAEELKEYAERLDGLIKLLGSHPATTSLAARYKTLNKQQKRNKLNKITNLNVSDYQVGFGTNGAGNRRIVDASPAK